MWFINLNVMLVVEYMVAFMKKLTVFQDSRLVIGEIRNLQVIQMVGLGKAAFMLVIKPTRQNLATHL